jgi:hypothetical protein
MCRAAAGANRATPCGEGLGEADASPIFPSFSLVTTTNVVVTSEKEKIWEGLQPSKPPT